MTKRTLIPLAVFALLGAALVIDGVFEHRPRREKTLADFSDEAVTSRFIELYLAKFRTTKLAQIMGIDISQTPTDMWSVQDIVYETRPDIIIETGTLFGGSALYFATLLHVYNPEGRVITIDLKERDAEAKKNPLYQKYVTPIIGNSVGTDTLAEVRRLVQGKRALVFLDSAHYYDHVLKELRSYAEFVPVGGYMIVHDTFFGREANPDFGAGPREAVEAFMKTNRSFETDPHRTRFLLTFCEGGYLKRIS